MGQKLFSGGNPTDQGILEELQYLANHCEQYGCHTMFGVKQILPN